MHCCWFFFAAVLLNAKGLEAEDIYTFANQRFQGLVLTIAALQGHSTEASWAAAALLRHEGVCKSAPGAANSGLKMLRSEDL